MYWDGNRNACMREFLVDAKHFRFPNMDIDFVFSKVAQLPCGEIHKSDKVLLVDGAIGEIVCFRAIGEYLFVQLLMYDALTNLSIDVNYSSETFLDVDDIVEPILWYRAATHITIIRPSYS